MGKGLFLIGLIAIVCIIGLIYVSDSTENEVKYKEAYDRCINSQRATVVECEDVYNDCLTSPMSLPSDCSLILETCESEHNSGCSDCEGCCNPCGSACGGNPQPNLEFKSWLAEKILGPFSSGECMAVCTPYCMEPPK